MYQRQRVGGAPELLLDEEPLGLRPTLAAVLGGVQATRQPRGHGLVLDALLELAGDVAAGQLGLLLVGDEDVLDEAPGALLQLELLGREVARELRGGGGDGHALPPLRVRRPGERRLARPRARLSWFRITSSTSARASATSLAARGGIGERRHTGEIFPPRAAAAAGHEPLDSRPLSLHQIGRRGARGAQRGDRLGQLALGFWSDREPCVTGAEVTHGAMVSCD